MRKLGLTYVWHVHEHVRRSTYVNRFTGPSVCVIFDQTLPLLEFSGPRTTVKARSIFEHHTLDLAFVNFEDEPVQLFVCSGIRSKSKSM